VRVQFVLKFAISIALVAVTFAVFAQTLGHDFVNYDDRIYVNENQQIQAGLNWRNIIWAFTHVHSHNWHPLTTMSHMLDCQLFGLRPGAHHFVNVLLHSASAVLLFLLLDQMSPSSPRDESVRLGDRTGPIWSSAFVAAIFAIHPLHVESVAWISERKDVLSGLFFVLTLLAYSYYTRKPSIGRYVTMSILFACGLLSKPMLVTLPIILLLVDYWPLNRFQQSSAMQLILEKIPLFVLSIGSAVATLIAQRGGIVQIEHLPLTWRAANAVSVYLIYIWQMVWPENLATIYPHPGRLPFWETASASALLVLVTAGAFTLRKRQPYLITGWLWYLIMLLPVIGLIQVGSQAHADRYTYLSQIGLYLAVTWGIVDLSRSFPYRREVLTVTAPVVIAVLAWRAWIQTAYWHDTERLWNRTFAVTKQNDIAHLNMGEYLLKSHRLDEAITQFEIVLASQPYQPDANFQLGSAFMEKGDLELAIRHFERTLKIEPDNPEAETNLANMLLKSERVEEAVDHYRNVVRHEPSSALGHYNLAVGLHRLGLLPEAIVHYKEALRLEPGYPDADYFLGQALLQNGQPDEAKIHLEKH
jgi:protein O-mannosyl-transferase